MGHDFLHAGYHAGFVGAQPRKTAIVDWGRFEGDGVCSGDGDGQTLTLEQPLIYTDPRSLRWRVEAGTCLEEPSLPRPFWPVIGGPFEGAFLKASVLHTVACMSRIRPWRAIHRMFYEACRCSGVDAAKAKAMYYVVFHFGPRWHIEEPSSLVARGPHAEVVVRDLTPAPPTVEEVAAIVTYFSNRDVAAEDVPKLDILDSDD